MSVVASPFVPYVEVDFNVRARGDLVRARLSKVRGDVSIGDTVIVIEPFEGLRGRAVVDQIDIDRGFVYLAVDWASVHPPTSEEQGVGTVSAIAEAERLAGPQYRVVFHDLRAEFGGGVAGGGLFGWQPTATERAPS
jgi:hypothetical protein